MALVECRECGHEVSTGAATCPKCGVAHPGKAASKDWHPCPECSGATVLKRQMGIVAWVFLAAVFLFLVGVAIPWEVIAFTGVASLVEARLARKMTCLSCGTTFDASPPSRAL